MFDLHMHSLFSDGKDTPEDMILEAIRKGLNRVGLSDHSHAEGDECCMSTEESAEYRETVAELKEKYRDRIEVLCGLERDYYSDDYNEYDYVIGSVHTLKMPDGHFVCVDWTAEKLERDVNAYFGGDWYALAEAFYAMEKDVMRKTKCDIIGHFDLMTKFQERQPFFDETHPRYVRAWQDAADALLETGKVFEVNTGAISRGYRTSPYPAEPIRKYLLERGAVLILSSDAHAKEKIAFQFDRWKEGTFQGNLRLKK